VEDGTHAEAGLVDVYSYPTLLALAMEHQLPTIRKLDLYHRSEKERMARFVF
jgi:hypothetical protein